VSKLSATCSMGIPGLSSTSKRKVALICERRS
jgi:hypothetical protein